MSHKPDEHVDPRAAGGGFRAAIVLALVAAGALAGYAGWRWGVARPAPPLSPEKIVADTLAAEPVYTPFFAGITAKFPADSAHLNETFAARVAAAKGPVAPERFVADALKELRQTRGVVATKADAPALARVFSAQGAMLDALAGADPKLCVDFVFGGASEAFLAFAAAHRPLLAEVAGASLDAILDGDAKKIEREAPTDADFAALETALRAKGLGEAEISLLLDGKAPDPPLSDPRMCEAARDYVAALLALPEPARSRVQALAIELMARS